MKHGREAAQTFPADGSNDIALGGTPATKNDGGMGRSGGEERARFERNVTHTHTGKATEGKVQDISEVNKVMPLPQPSSVG